MSQRRNVPIVHTLWGSEQRSLYRNADLQDEEVPEFDIGGPLTPCVAPHTVALPVLVVGDQNAGKTTFLHTFTNADDPNFTQLCSFLPIMASECANTHISRASTPIMDEFPFLDTDVGRSHVTMTMEHFNHFCQEFTLEWLLKTMRADTRFVILDFIELGGDHLDMLIAQKKASDNSDHYQPM